MIDEYCMASEIDTGEQDAGRTALHLVKRRRVDILKYMLEKEANATFMDHRGRTPPEKLLGIKDKKIGAGIEGSSEG